MKVVRFKYQSHITNTVTVKRRSEQNHQASLYSVLTFSLAKYIVKMTIKFNNSTMSPNAAPSPFLLNKICLNQ